MKKIPTIFKRYEGNPKLVSEEVNPAASWVLDGEGRPTRKFDGSAVLVRDGGIFKRFDCKKGRTPPDGFESADDPDPITGHWPGWVPVGEGPEDKWFRAAIDDAILALASSGSGGLVPILTNGTYEAVGPHFQGNPDGFRQDTLVRHGATAIEGNPRTSADLKAFFEKHDMEGIVWHHPDGRMAKIKARDFGIKRTQTIVRHAPSDSAGA